VAGHAVADRAPGRDEDELEEGALTYTSYWVEGYTTPRIRTDEVQTRGTTAAVANRGPAAKGRPPSGPLSGTGEPS
jgi:hypothetical protein